MGVAERTAFIHQHLDELLVTIGRAAKLDHAEMSVLFATTSARLATNPLVAAGVAGPLAGLLYVALVELAKATERSVDEVVAEYRVASVVAMQQAQHIVGGKPAT